MLQLLKQAQAKLAEIPRWRLYVYGALIACALVYLGWCRWGPRPQAPGEAREAKHAPEIAKMPRREIRAKVSTVRDKEKAVQNLGLPKQEAENPQEHLQDAFVGPPSRYGTTTAVFLNTTTGKTRAAVKVNEAPWFRLERGNEVGYELQQGLHGRRHQVDYSRDVASVKGATITIKAGARYEEDTRELDPFVGARLKYSW